MGVIEVEGLRKRYVGWRGKQTTALDGLDLSVPEGGVYGFLGPNGSGKTTTIRCLLGLIRPSAGSSRVLGVDSRRSLGEVVSRVGSIVETPRFFPNFSGERNLTLFAGLDGIEPTRVRAALETTGLTERARDSFRSYSLGMKQRLGMAAVLMKDPELLILDEPANGLDPAGIVEVRELVRRLGAEGRTVFVSSHLLAEVQQMCDRVAILNRGRCVAAGPVDDVLTQGGGGRLVVRVEEPRRAEDVLTRAGFEVTRDGDAVLVTGTGRDGAQVSRCLAGAGMYPWEITAQTVDLETVFLELTGRETSG